MIPGLAALLVLGALAGLVRENWVQLQTTAAQSKEAAELLVRTQRRTAALLDRIPVGVFRVTPQGELLHGNDALARLFGHTGVVELSEAIERGGHPIVEGFRRLVAAIELRGSVLGSEAQTETSPW